MKVNLLISVVMSCYFIGFTGATTFTPAENYPGEILTEMSTNRFQRINLKNKPLAFSSESKIFDFRIAEDFVQNILRYSQETIRVLDLSLNRLPEDSLVVFLPLLRLKTFEFLDVTINSGADSLDAMRILNENLRDVSREDLVSIFKKIIWVPCESLDRATYLPDAYKAAHRDYYRRYKHSDFELPY